MMAHLAMLTTEIHSQLVFSHKVRVAIVGLYVQRSVCIRPLVKHHIANKPNRHWSFSLFNVKKSKICMNNSSTNVILLSHL